MCLNFQWASLCKTYLVEAEWYHKDCKPSFHEYLENAWISSSGPIILLNGYFALLDSTNTDDSILFREYSNVVHYTSNIMRLTNDLGTYKVSQYNPFNIYLFTMF